MDQITSKKLSNWLNNIWNTVKKKWQSTIVIRRLLFLVIFAGCCTWCYKIFKHKERPHVNTSLAPVSMYKDKQGNSHTILEVQDIEKEQLKKQVKEYKKLLQDKNIKIKQLSTTINSIDTSFKSDSSTGGNFFLSKKDDNISLVITKDSSNQATINLSIIDTQTFVNYTTRKWFKPTQHRVDIKHSNKLITTTGGNFFNLQESRSIVSLGLQAGYNPFTNRPYVGIGVQFNIINIKIKK